MKKISCLFIMAILSGCAGTDYFASNNGMFGYNDVKLQDNIFKIGYQGTGVFSVQKSEDYALLRASEVTLGNGYKYFRALNSSDDMKTAVHTNQETGRTRLVQRPATVMMIQCYNEKPANATDVIYDAEQIKTNIRNSYGIK